MKNFIKLLAPLLIFMTVAFSGNSQCNTNISICTPGVAGPFTFSAASPDPSSCLDYWNGQAAPNYAYIILYITTAGDLNLLIDGDQATGCLDVSIFDITGVADPCASLGLATEIGCNYASACDGCNEFGSNFPCASEVPAPIVNVGDVIMILVEDWSDVMTNFTLELSNAPGSAQTGPPDATINQPPTVCATSGPIQLTAADNGGTWSGPGVSPTGEFDPAAVGVGTYNIAYTIGSAPCIDNATSTIEVIDCTVPTPCPFYENTPDAEAKACGGQLYDFDVVNTACAAIVSFDVIGNYGTWGNEITWTVTSVLTGNVVASGGPGWNNGAINVTVNLDPNVEGTVFNLEVFDTFGDGITGGGFIQVEDGGNVIAGPFNSGNFSGPGGGPITTNQVFVSNIDISATTMTVVTPSGNVVSNIDNCADHHVQFTLANANFCTQIQVNLPWWIICDDTGDTISSGIHPVIVYPTIATSASDLVTVNWNAGTCQWDISPNNDCDLLDVGTIFTISPDPTAWPTNTCTGGNQDFTVDYLGVPGSPDCCATGGPLVPITYDETTIVSDATVISSPYGGQNNTANVTIPANGAGGASTSFNLNVTGSGYCYPNPAGTSTDDSWYVIIWVDGVQVSFNGPFNGTTFNINVTAADLTAAGVTYDQNSVIEVYVLPNLFNTNAPTIYTNYVPGVPCGTLGDGEWTIGSLDASLTTTFTDLVAGPANCTFVANSPYTCCVVDLPTASNPPNINVECSGGVPAIDPTVVTDEVSPCNPVVTHLSDVSDNQSCPETITRTYRVTDDCGNFTDVQQLLIIGDVTPPVLAAPPVAVTVQCGAIPPMVNLAWTDNCDGAGTVAGSDGPLVGGNCGGTITRTWTYADGCGNSDTETQIITVNDTQAPVMNAPPADIPVQCVGDIPAMIDLGYTDNCDPVGVVTGTEVSDNGSCPETITRTWTFTDLCGNVSTPVTQTITVWDTQAPVMTAAPADLPVQCIGDVPLIADLAYTDNCDPSGNAVGVEVSDNGSCPETITRTWTFTDACGNTATETQIITIWDTQAPIMTAAPADLPVQCIGDVPLIADLAYTDNCDPSGNAVGVEVSDNGSCPETITRTWTFTDACGNTATETQIITIWDTQAPVFAAPPADAIVQCVGDVPAMTDLGWTDNCDGANTVTGVDGALTDPCGGTITRTWTYTDACGNVATVTQTITVGDTQNPTASNPGPQAGTPPPPDPTVVIDELDNCGVPVVAWVSDVSDNGNCPEIITRTYSVTDACLNQILVTQTFTIGDLIFPTASDPAPMNVECIGDVLPTDPTVVIDENDNGGTPVVIWEDDTSDNGSCPETILRRYRVTDDCGNFIFVTQTITVWDVTAPVMDVPPAATAVQCIGDVPAMIDLGYTDNCDAAGTVTGTDVSDNGSCPETITRTWTFTDICGNVSTPVTQIITVHDTQAPVMAAAPADIAVQCIGDVAAIADLAYTDNCDPSGNAIGVEVSDNGSCPETITRTWTFTDACGNIATETQVITVHDTQAPVMTAAPADIAVQCIGDVPVIADLAYTDNCDAPGNAVGVEVSDNGSCPETITRTWTFTDVCGNIATETQIITIHDTQVPVFAAPPVAISVQCVGDVPAMTDLGWTDNCDGANTVTGVDGALTDPCGGTITRTWTYTDACGNIATVTQTITVGDTQPPTASAPAPISAAGIGAVPPANILDVIDELDNCTVNPVVLWVGDISDNGVCPEIITRTYSITDDCGNSITVDQIITVGDAIFPTASDPTPVNVECIGNVPAIDPTVVIDEWDNGNTPVVIWEDDTSDNGSCPETILRRYRVTDDCGNFIFVTQTITVMDVTAPVMDAPPAAIAVECIGDVPLMTDLGYTDNCDPIGVVTGTDVSDNGSCPETITRTWTYTDVCGNVSAPVTQIITVQDTQAPILALPLNAVTLSCIGDLPPMVDMDYTDNCDAPGAVTGTDVSDNGSCPEIITRTWTYTDICGNTTSVSRIITIHDLVPPVFAIPPVDVTVECVGDVPAMTDLGWTDNCDGAGTVTGADGALVGGNCGGTITRTWTYTDACGNIATVTQTITVDDTTPPTASNPATTTVPGGPVPPVDINVVIDEADNCTVNPVVALVSESSDNNPCPETITRIYSVTDDCGNTINVTHLIVITDPIMPTGTPPAAASVECIGDVPVADPLLITDEWDNQGVPVVAWESDVSDNGSCPEIITRTYSITDLCGNIVLVDQLITVMDITAPIMNAPPAAAAVQCIGDVPAMTDLGYTDNCDAAGTVTGNDVSDNGSCPETITRTWTYTDNCGNVSASVTQIITVHDTQVPVFAAPPVAVSVQCVGDIPAMTDLGWTDNCDGAGAVTGTDGVLLDPCGGSFDRTWTYTDACGNIATVTQTITVDDTTNPTASNPATTTVPGGPVPVIDINVVIDEADNCTVNPVVTFVSELSDNNPCPETITRIYSVTDDCGNTIDVTHLIVITDPVFPTGTAPANVAVECIGDVPTNDPLLITDEADNQGIPVVAWVGDVSDNGSCPEIITRTYSITDLCGNVITVDQLITVMDITNPTATAPTTVNVECIGDVPAANVLDITNEADNCTLNPVVAHVGDVSDNGSCPETITRTYSITDDCGNSITVDQLIIVNDITPPTGTAPAIVSVECIGDVPAWNITDITTEADNCTANPTVAWIGDQSDGQSCPETITRTYSITDDCGNSITVDQLIVVNDVTPPTANNAQGTSVPTANDVPAPDPTVITTEADNCTVNPVVAWISDVSDGNVCNLEKITRTFSVTDDCGNQIFVTEVITILAEPAPIDAGPDQSICEGDLVTIVAGNPWGVPIVWNPVVPNGPFDPGQTTTYTVTADNGGCISTDDITITVEEAPVISFLGDTLSGCEPLTVNFTNTSSAPSGLTNCEWLINGQTISGCGNISYTFQNSGTYDVTLTATSGTGCTASATYTDYIYVEETPMASFTPSSSQVTTMNTEVNFNNTSMGAVNYEWEFGDDSATSTQENPSHEFPAGEEGSYVIELIAFSPLGCSDTAWMTVEVVEELIYYVPNSFTPDGDNFNEYFQAVFTSGYDPFDFEMLIFNRWGEVIWESHDDSVGWDGTYGSGQELVADGVYSWRIEFKKTANDERVLVTGHVVLIR